MPTRADVEKILKWTRENNARITIFFKQYPYTMVFEKMLRSYDKNEKIISWNKAFNKPPEAVLNTFRIEKIVVRKENNIEILSSFKELLKMIK